jgi:hypothetical protein
MTEVLSSIPRGSLRLPGSPTCESGAVTPMNAHPHDVHLGIVSACLVSIDPSVARRRPDAEFSRATCRDA